MRIAFLIVAHRDPEFIIRVCKKLIQDKNFEVFLHYDLKSNIDTIWEEFKNEPGVTIAREREKVYWSGFSSIKAILKIMQLAFDKGGFDRYVMLQGADYPLYSNSEITDFFMKNRQVEFIRACNMSNSTDSYFYKKNRCHWFCDRPNFLKKKIHYLNYKFTPKLRKPSINENERKYDVHFGSAQWAITKECVAFILDFVAYHPKFMRYMKTVFAPDEIFFHSIVHNSKFKHATITGDTEPCKRLLVNWRNLNYFEYPNERVIKVFDETDYQKLIDSNCMFFRKAQSVKSKVLLDKIDKMHTMS